LLIRTGAAGRGASNADAGSRGAGSIAGREGVARRRRALRAAAAAPRPPPARSEAAEGLVVLLLLKPLELLPPLPAARRGLKQKPTSSGRVRCAVGAAGAAAAAAAAAKAAA